MILLKFFFFDFLLSEGMINKIKTKSSGAAPLMNLDSMPLSLAEIMEKVSLVDQKQAVTKTTSLNESDSQGSHHKGDTIDLNVSFHLLNEKIYYFFFNDSKILISVF